MRIFVRLCAAVGIAVLLFAGVTGWALEWDGVMIVTTRTTEGQPRETHIWYAREGEKLWLEAGLPENPWYQDVLLDPIASLSADDVSGEYELSTVPGREAARHVRALMREKYGLRDRWVLFFVDASRTTAVLARPVDAASARSR
jgi:hypothetical protein